MLRLPGAFMQMGGKVVVVVYVVVTTVVLVAGAKENWPMVAYGSTCSACRVFDTASEPRPRPEGVGVMLHGESSAVLSVLSVFGVG